MSYLVKRNFLAYNSLLNCFVPAPGQSRLVEIQSVIRNQYLFATNQQFLLPQPPWVITVHDVLRKREKIDVDWHH